MKLHWVQVIESGHQKTPRLFELGLSFQHCKKIAFWPSLNTMNDFLSRGHDDGELGTDIKWESCELTQDEYIDAIDAVMNGSNYKIDDKDVDWTTWINDNKA